MDKIFLNCPTHEIKEYCLEQYSDSVKALTYENIQILIGDNSPTQDYSRKIANLGLPVIQTPYSETARERIITARNLLREHFLASDCEWFFSLEQDVLLPIDAIQRLLAHNKKIISGLYLNPYDTPLGIQNQPVLWKGISKEEFDEKSKNHSFRELCKIKNITSFDQVQLKFTKEDLKEPRLIEVNAAGLGCLLVHREVIEKINFRYDPNITAFDDMFFCKDARALGFKIYADTSIKCRHAILGGQWKGIKK